MQVDIEKIIPVTEARDSFNKIVDEVEGSDHLYVLTKNGKPAAVVVGVNHLEKLTGETGEAIQAKVNESNTVDTTGDQNPFITPGDKPAATSSATPQPAPADPFAAPTTPPADQPVAAPKGEPVIAPNDEPIVAPDQTPAPPTPPPAPAPDNTPTPPPAQ